MGIFGELFIICWRLNDYKRIEIALGFIYVYIKYLSVNPASLCYFSKEKLKQVVSE